MLKRYHLLIPLDVSVLSFPIHYFQPVHALIHLCTLQLPQFLRVTLKLQIRFWHVIQPHHKLDQDLDWI